MLFLEDLCYSEKGRSLPSRREPLLPITETRQGHVRDAFRYIGIDLGEQPEGNHIPEGTIRDLNGKAAPGGLVAERLEGSGKPIKNSKLRNGYSFLMEKILFERTIS